MQSFWRKPRLEPRNVTSLQLYSTDDLRRLYQGEPRVGGDDDLIQIRDGIVRRHELRAEILAGSGGIVSAIACCWGCRSLPQARR